MMNRNDRREFLKQSVQAAMIVAAEGIAAAPLQSAPLKISIFSKHLQFLEWEAMTNAAKEIGFDGVDLTLRKGGHIEPERAEQDLPKVAAIIRKAGLEFSMIPAVIIGNSSPALRIIAATLGKSCSARSGSM